MKGCHGCEGIEALLRRALELAFCGRAREALPMVERAEAASRGHTAATVTRAVVLVRLNRAAEARLVARRVLAQAPEHLAALVALGDACAALGRLAEADRAYAGAEAVAAAERAAGDDARAAAKRAAGDDARTANARAAIGAGSAAARYRARRHARVLVRLERYDEALAVVDRVRAAVAEGDALLEAARGWVLLAAGRAAEAGVVAEAASARWPEDRRVRRLAYEVRTRARPAAETAAELDRALGSAGGRENVELWIVRARRAAEAGEWLREAESWLAVHALAPRDGGARRRAGFAFKKAGELARAIACLEPEFLADPRDVFVRGCLLRCLEDNGERVRARAVVDRALAAHPHVRALLGIRRKVAARVEAAS